MASRSTRSSGRRSESLMSLKSSHNIATATPNTTTTTRPHHVTINNNNLNIAKQEANTSRKKRPRHEEIIVSQPELKKARYAVEIESKPFALSASPSKARSLITHNNHNAPSNTKQTQPPLPIHKAPVQQPQSPPQPPQNTTPPQTQTQTQTLDASGKSTIHNLKVANGLKHELDRLQPAQVDTKDEKRKLRSQEGARFKSELSLYFPEYDEVIGNDPKEDHVLNHDTPIIIFDSSKSPAKPQYPSAPTRNSNAKKFIGYPIKKYPDTLFSSLNEAQRIDFSFLDSHCKDKAGENPLPDSFYETVHKKPERHEKSIRNTDKGRAQHEKNQVIRLLEGLQGHDWLKLMGVSGITDGRKKEFEPARDHFIRGCTIIIEKFKLWRDEEKRRRIEKEQAMAAAEEENAAEEDDDDVDNGSVSDGDPPDYSDVDVSAARQLHEEAIARSAPLTTSKRSRPKADEAPAPPPVEKDFKSFFSKPYLREAALHKHRRSGRSVAAWGLPVPELAEQDFDLPEEYRDEETLRVHARRKRRDRRISRD
ncbi:hypothetical protein PVAG01_06307 [Phlyctema vagabunda]|uniref:Something about silencing protein 4 domain-containing protein n=1 Tax=Phlyctema vagabunda TaxID=108571 RepID=A0ABR4PGL9_9HELO